MNWPALSRQLRKTVRYYGYGAGAKMLGLAALRRLVTFERLYFLELVAKPELPEPRADREVCLADPEDIVAMARDPVWNLELTAEDVDNLFRRGHRCALNRIGGRIAGYAWMNPSRLVAPKLRAALVLGPGEVHVYKGFTHPDFRGQRIRADRFAHWYVHLTEKLGTKVFADFAFDNPATLAHHAERLGFRPVGSGTYLEYGDLERCWMTGALASHPRERVEPDIAHRDH